MIKIFRSNKYNNEGELEAAVNEFLKDSPNAEIRTPQGEGFYDILIRYPRIQERPKKISLNLNS